MSTSHIELRLLGRFLAEVDGEDVTDDLNRHSRAADLVKLLALTPAHRLHREQVMSAFWPELDPQRAGANLRKAAHHARRALRLDDGLVLADEHVTLGAGHVVDTDVATLYRVAESALESADRAASREAVALCRRPLLADDPYASWAAGARAEIDALHIRLLATGELWGRLVEVDPTNEPAHQAIVAGHLRNGDRAAALRQYEELRVALRDHLGVLPSRASTALYEQALAMDTPDSPTAAERARALLAWGVVHWEREDVAEAERTARSARALAIDAGLGRELAEASELLGLIAYAQGNWREMFAEEFIGSISETPELSPFLLDAHMCMSEFALGEASGLRDVAELSDEILKAADRVGSTQGTAFGRLLRGEVLLLSEVDPIPASDLLEDARRMHEGSGSATGVTLAVERMAQVEAAVGNAAVADQRHREALEMARESPARRHLVPFVFGGMLLDAPGDTDRQLVDEADRAIAGMDVCDPCAMAYRVGVVHATAATGDFDTATRYLRQAEEVARMWAGGPWHAHVEEAKGGLALAARDESAAVDHLESAMNGFAVSRRPRDRARCHATLARIT